MPALLDIRDLHVSFSTHRGVVQAVRGASLALEPGEILGLVGESGSGKSVLGHAALGLLTATPAPQLTGELWVDGVDMVRASPEQRRLVRQSAIGAVFQDPMSSLNPVMRIGRQVAEAAGEGTTTDDIVELLEATGIHDARHKLRAYPHELSGGLRQRVMIAMALARRPKLLIADEATTALDVTVQAQVLELLARAARDLGVAVVLITHDLGVAAEICDRIAVAYAGQIVETGPAASVLAAPQHPYTLGLLACRPRLDGGARGGELPTLPGLLPDPTHERSGCAFLARCPQATAGCDASLPLHTDDAAGRSVLCHRPAALAAWPLHGREATDPAAELFPPHDAAVTPDGAPAVAISGVTKVFARPRTRPWQPRPEPLVAVDGVDLTVPAGGAVAVVGESGSGKSTLLRMVVGLERPTAGSIQLPAGAPAPQMVFQDAGASLTPWRTARELIGERLALCGVAPADRPARIEQALRDVGLDPAIGSLLPRRMSGGQRQRVAIARAIAVPPPLLVCDEPVSALDVSLAAQVLNLLCGLRERLGIALLFVTHDLATARAVADDLIVMRRGAVVERGPTGVVLDDPQHSYTQQLLASVPRLPMELVA